MLTELRKLHNHKTLNIRFRRVLLLSLSCQIDMWTIKIGIKASIKNVATHRCFALLVAVCRKGKWTCNSVTFAIDVHLFSNYSYCFASPESQQFMGAKFSCYEHLYTRLWINEWKASEWGEEFYAGLRSPSREEWGMQVRSLLGSFRNYTVLQLRYAREK